MRRLVVVILAVILPIYGQEKGPKPNPDKEHADKVNQPQESNPPPFIKINVINQETAKEEENGAKNHAEGYFSRLFSPENLPSVGLLIAGLIGIFYARRTLQTIQDQTKATRISADAAKASADALIRMERPRMHPVNLIEPRDLLDRARDNCPNPIEISIRLNNTGRTEARVVGWYINTFISPTRRVLPFEYTSNNSRVDYPVEPGAGENLYKDFAVEGFTVVDDIRAGRNYFYVYGVLRYRDVFQLPDDPPHETFFSRRYTFRRTTEGTEEGWEVDGPDGANRRS